MVESFEERTMMSTALSGIGDRSIPLPAAMIKPTSSLLAKNGANQVSPGATPIDLNFYTPLKLEIEKLKDAAGYDKTTMKYDESKVPEGRKALLLDRALANYEHLVGKTSPMVALGLPHPSEYALSKTQTPAYFSNNFKDAATNVQVTPGFYSYNTAQYPEKTQFWVDFANAKLGGGVFGTGFVQEETMFMETPELANAAAQNLNPAVGHYLMTRTSTAKGALAGSPEPLIFLGANRVMALDPALSKSPAKGQPERWQTISVDGLKNADVPLTAPQKINVLAIAAPHLDTKADGNKPDSIKDLFNTFVAGFTLAASEGVGQPILIHTGPIGTGDFMNNRAVVYVLQRLAGMEVGNVNLNFWAYTTSEEQTDNSYFNTIIGAFNASTNKSVNNLLTIAHGVLAKILVT